MKKKLTEQTKPISVKNIKRKWYLVDAGDKILGRIAPKIASLLQGKNKVDYVSYLDNGDYVVVINAEKVKFTGKKLEQKIYTHYSGYPGGLKTITLKELMKKSSEKVIINAVFGMLPKNKLRDKRLKRLFVFKDENHSFKNIDLIKVN